MIRCEGNEHMTTATVPIGMTTTKAPLIEQAQNRGAIDIEQPKDRYSEENKETWRRLYALITPKWQKYANRKFLEGVNNLALDPNNVPRLEDINKSLSPLSGFKAKAVSGYVPAYVF